MQNVDSVVSDIIVIGAGGCGLKQTIQDYNSAASGGKDAFGRTLPEPFSAPFYGIKVAVALYPTQRRAESKPGRPGPPP